jgi:hypothetical protein
VARPIQPARVNTGPSVRSRWPGRSPGPYAAPAGWSPPCRLFRVMVSVRCPQSRPRCSMSAPVASDTRSPFSASSLRSIATSGAKGGEIFWPRPSTRAEPYGLAPGPRGASTRGPRGASTRPNIFPSLLRDDPAGHPWPPPLQAMNRRLSGEGPRQQRPGQAARKESR